MLLELEVSTSSFSQEKKKKKEEGIFRPASFIYCLLTTNTEAELTDIKILTKHLEPAARTARYYGCPYQQIWSACIHTLSDSRKKYSGKVNNKGSKVKEKFEPQQPQT